MSFKQPKYACSDCGYPAKTLHIFVNDKPPYNETLDCPECGSSSIVSEEI